MYFVIDEYIIRVLMHIIMLTYDLTGTMLSFWNFIFLFLLRDCTSVCGGGWGVWPREHCAMSQGNCVLALSLGKFLQIILLLFLSSFLFVPCCPWDLFHFYI